MRMASGWRSTPFRLRCRSATRSRRLMAAARTGRACGWLSSMVALPPIAAANGPTSMACATTWSAASPDRKALLCCRAVGWSNAALAGLRIGAACCATAPDGWMSQPGVSPSSPFCLVFRHCSIQCQSSNSHFGFCGLVVGWVNDGHQGGAARPSRWKRRRFCKGEGEQQILPRREDQIDRDRRQLAEEIAAWPKLGPCGAPEFIADVADGVDGERQQVQADQDGGEGLLAVSEAVLEVVALGLEHVERLVLDLPSRPATGGQFDDGTGADRQIGDAAVAIRRLAPGVDDLDREPVDPERVLAVAQRHVM